MPANQILVFDMDGVLVDVTDSYREAIQQTVAHFTGLQVSRDTIQDFKNAGGWNDDFTLSHRMILDTGRDVAYQAVVDYFQAIFHGNGTDGLILRERWIAHEGLLERLSRHFQLALFTGRMRWEAEVTLRRFARSLSFEPIVGADDVARLKPAPDGLLQIAHAASGKKLWYVGDTVDDARSARAAAVPFIGIAAPLNPRRQQLVELFQAEQAVAVLDDINQLERVLGQ